MVKLFASHGSPKSYAERLFSFPEVGALSETDAAKALQDPARASGAAFDPAALEEVFQLTINDLMPTFIEELHQDFVNRFMETGEMKMLGKSSE